MCICLLTTFPRWVEEMDEEGSERDVRPFPSRPVMQVTNTASAAGVLFALISSLWQHTAAVAAATTAQNFAYGFMESEVGATAMALGWAALAINVIAMVGMISQYIGILTLDTLVDE